MEKRNDYSSIINEILKEYNYVNFTKDEIEECSKNINMKDFVTEFKRKLDEKVSKKINNNIEIINNYINLNIKVNNDIKSCIKEIRKIADFFEKINFEENLERYFSYIKNNEKIMRLLEVIDKKRENYYSKCRKESVRKIIEVYNITKSRLSDSDIELLDKIHECSNESRNELFSKYMHIVDELLSSTAKPLVEKEDLRQEGYVALLKVIDNYSLENNFDFGLYASWFIKYTINKYNQKVELKTEITEENICDNLEENLIQKDFKVRFTKFLQELGINKEEINIVLMIESGLTYEQIAKKLNKSTQNILSTVKLTLEKIRRSPNIYNFLIYTVNQETAFDFIDTYYMDNTSKEENKKKVNAVIYTLPNLYYALLELGCTEENIKKILKSMESITKGLTMNLGLQDVKTSVIDKLKENYLSSLRESLNQTKCEINEKEIFELMSKPTIKLDIFSIMKKRGYKDHEIKESLEQISEARLNILLESAGGCITNPKEVLKESVNCAFLKLAISRLETILSNNKNIVMSVEERKRYLYNIKCKAEMILHNYSLEASFMTQRDALIVILHIGLVDSRMFTTDEISEIIGVSSRYVKRTLCRNTNIFLNNIDYREKSEIAKILI